MKQMSIVVVHNVPHVFLERIVKSTRTVLRKVVITELIHVVDPGFMILEVMYRKDVSATLVSVELIAVFRLLFFPLPILPPLQLKLVLVPLLVLF
jgi:hypothetical protein